jgi:hypothetical protein
MPNNKKEFDGGKIQVPITLLMKRNLLKVMEEHPHFYITDAARWLMEKGLIAYAEEQKRSIEDVGSSEPTNKPERPAFFAS